MTTNSTSGGSYSSANSDESFLQSALQSNLWVKSPSFDLAFVTGGAFFTLAIAAVAFAQPTLLPIFFWLWIICFEGSHFWATFSRTYIDPKFRRENKAVLYGSLVFFAFPALAVFADSIQSQISYTTIYGFFIFVWSLYHNARQHYGFLSIYSGKAKLSPQLKNSLARTLYFAVGAAQIYFLMNFKLQGAFGVPALNEFNANLGFLVSQLPLIVSLGTIVYFAYLTFQAVQSHGATATASLYYILVCWVFYSMMFYVIAPKDTLMQNMSGGETLMLIAIMNSLFHNIQYHAIVWFYGQKRYAGRSTDTSEFGAAKVVNGSSLNYFLVALGLGLVFAGITWNVGDWPSFSGSWQGVSPHKWAYIVFFGIIGHHFFLDQKIWRPSQQSELKDYLGLKNN